MSDCEQVEIWYYDYIFPTISGVSAISMIPAIFMYIRAFIKGNLKTIKSLFYIGAIHFTVTFCAFTSYTIQMPQLCHNPRIFSIFRNITVQLYIMQNLILLGLFFYRLQRIFRDTKFKLSNVTIIFFITFIVLFSIFFIFSGVMWAQGKMQILPTIAGGLLLILTIYLVGLFIYKLRKIVISNKTDGHGVNKQGLIIVMRKTSLLAFVSTINILFSAIANVILGRVESVHSYFGFALIIVADMETSFLCIILSYSYFKGYYDKLCGCCEICCLSACSKCIGNQIQHEANNNLEYVPQTQTKTELSSVETS